MVFIQKKHNINPSQVKKFIKEVKSKDPKFPTENLLWSNYSFYINYYLIEITTKYVIIKDYRFYNNTKTFILDFGINTKLIVGILFKLRDIIKSPDNESKIDYLIKYLIELSNKVYLYNNKSRSSCKLDTKKSKDFNSTNEVLYGFYKYMYKHTTLKN